MTPIRSFCWRFGCGTIHGCNLLLALLAVALTGLIFLNSFQKEVPLPEQMIHWILPKAVDDDYQLTWSRAVFDLQGGLYLEEVQLIRRSSEDTLMTSGVLRIKWSPFNLLLGISPAFSEITAERLHLYIPASHSLSGLNEAVAEIQHVFLQENDGQLVIENLLLRSRGLRISLRGSAPLSALQGPKREALDWAGINRILEQAHQIPSDLEADGLVLWSMDPSGNHRFLVRMLCDHLSLPPGSFKRVDVETEVNWSGGQLGVTRFTGQANLSHLETIDLGPTFNELPIDFPLVFSFTADGPLVEQSLFRIPSDIHLTLRGAPLVGLPSRIIQIRTSLLDEAPVLHWTWRDTDLFVSGTAHPNPAGVNKEPCPEALFPFPFDFRATLRNPVLENFFPHLPEHRLLHQAQARYLRIDAATTPDRRGLSGYLTSDHLYLGQTPFAHVRTRFNIQPSHFALTEAFIRKSPNEEAFGSYFHNLDSSRFSLNARGSIFPSSLDAILGPWWLRIFTDIEVSSPPTGDVTVWGYWREADALKASVGAIGDGVRYRGIEIPRLRVGVRSKRDWVYVHQLEAGFASGKIDGTIGWVKGLEDDQMEPMVLHFRSTAAWPIASRATGLEDLERMEIGGSPQVEVRGTIWTPPYSTGIRPRERVPDLRFSLNQRTGLSQIEGLPLSRLNAIGRATGRRLWLDAVSGEFAEGVFTGRITMENPGGETKPRTHLHFQLFDADYPNARQNLTHLLKDPGESSLLQETEAGRLDADLDLFLPGEEGPPYGWGKISIREAPLGQIHLFGGLSRFLGGMGLGFSTLDLDTASLTWRLFEGVIDIPECLATGPILNVSLGGQLDLETRNLKMVADAYFFRGFVSKVLSPLSDNFRFDVEGPLEDPEWTLRLNPLRWLQNRIPGAP